MPSQDRHIEARVVASYETLPFPAGAEQIIEARVGVETCKDQVQHVRGVHAGLRTAGPSRGSFGKSLDRIFQKTSKSTPPRKQGQDLKVEPW